MMKKIKDKRKEIKESSSNDINSDRRKLYKSFVLRNLQLCYFSLKKERKDVILIYVYSIKERPDHKVDSRAIPMYQENDKYERMYLIRDDNLYYFVIEF
jgi:hypothetical protein